MRSAGAGGSKWYKISRVHTPTGRISIPAASGFDGPSHERWQQTMAGGYSASGPVSGGVQPFYDGPE